MKNDGKNRLETMIGKLKGNGYKITPQRLAILKILSTSIGHPSVEKIYEQVKKNFPTISRATVYKNILVIKDLGEVLELAFSNDSNRYDGHLPHPHPHAICTECKKIVDSELEILKDFTQKVREETGFRIYDHRIDFFGLCPDCQKNKE
ncbi:MAG: transcriptional repressor [Candidatus Brocadiae bacterium]|nr:transcriptional repressor [Candidatus Brocadiia bacterium]